MILLRNDRLFSFPEECLLFLVIEHILSTRYVLRRLRSILYAVKISHKDTLEQYFYIIYHIPKYVSHMINVYMSNTYFGIFIHIFRVSIIVGHTRRLVFKSAKYAVVLLSIPNYFDLLFPEGLFYAILFNISAHATRRWLKFTAQGLFSC